MSSIFCQTLISKVFIGLIITLSSCCNCDCDDIPPSFTSSELSWIPPHSIGDSVVFVCQDSFPKVFHVTRSQEFSDEPFCEGPCACCCPEDNERYYNYQLTGEPIPNTISVYEGFSIRLEKYHDQFYKEFSWSCMWGAFSQFDTLMDSLIINSETYYSVYKKEVNACTIKNVYFTKDQGLVKFEEENACWEIQ